MSRNAPTPPRLTLLRLEGGEAAQDDEPRTPALRPVIDHLAISERYPPLASSSRSSPKRAANDAYEARGAQVRDVLAKAIEARVAGITGCAAMVVAICLVAVLPEETALTTASAVISTVAVFSAAGGLVAHALIRRSLQNFDRAAIGCLLEQSERHSVQALPDQFGNRIN